MTAYFLVDDAERGRYIADVNLDMTELQRAEQGMREREQLLQGILDNAPVCIFVKDREGRYLLVSRLTAELAGRSPQEMRGKTDHELFPSALAERYVELDRNVLATREVSTAEEHLQSPHGLLTLLAVQFPLLDAQGDVYGFCGIATDVTERRRAEEKNRALQEEMLRVQTAALRALSTPLMPIAKGVLVMPLIGDVDQDRARLMTQTLLQGVGAHRARIAIVDVTGVTSAGLEVADGLVRAARAVRLLGAQVVLTGIQPRMAQMLTSMGASLEEIVTRGTLESGVAYAMNALRGG